jgi:hypothetical protein
MIRIVFTRLVVSMLAASMVAALGCAGPPQQSEDLPAPAESRPGEPRPQEPVDVGPHAVAQRFADQIGEQLDAQVESSVGSWSAARVARVWAAGDEYRAVVVQKNSAEKAPAVLLHVARDQQGAWQVVDQKPTTSTHLWPQL